MKTLELESYLDNNHKMTFSFFGLGFLFGLFNSLNNELTLNSILTTFIFLSLVILVAAGLILKKALLFSNDTLYNSLIIKNVILYRVEIKCKDYSSGKIKKLKQSKGFSLTFGPLTSLISESNAYSILLNHKGSESSSVLLSLTNGDLTKEVVKFIEATHKLNLKTLKF